VVDSLPFTAIYTYDGVMDNACWLDIQHGGGDGIQEGWGYSTATEGGMECMHWDNLPAAEYLLVMPPLALPAAEVQLRFKALGTAVAGGMFSVVVSPTGDTSAFTDTLTLTPDSVADYYTVPLTPYANELVLVAFRMAAPANVGTSVSVLREVSVTATAPLAPDTVWRTVTVNAVMDNGSHYDGLDEMVHGAGTYVDGSTVTLEGEVHGCSIGLSYWLTAEGDTLYDNPYTFVIHSDVTLTAVFAISGGIGDVEGGVFHLYPNPASTTVTVETERPATITLMDVSGRESGKWRAGSGETTIDISRLPKGVYFVRLDGSGAVRKLIVK
jgi:hypothetical protein